MVQHVTQQAVVDHSYSSARRQEVMQTRIQRTPDSTLAQQQTVTPAVVAALPVSNTKDTVSPESPLESEPVLTPKLALLKAIIERWRGDSIELNDYANLRKEMSITNQIRVGVESSGAASASPNATEILSVRETLVEQESLSVHFDIRFDSENQSTYASLDLSFERARVEIAEVTMTRAEFEDPLVINLSGNAELFDESSRSFDLDSDGQQEHILGLSSGVYYLGLDKNENGTIDDGSELFGAKTGNGFGELAAYDDDNNGLIDANDSIFEKLVLWREGEWIPLENTQVQGMSLNAVATPFTFTNDDGDPVARMRSSGVFFTADSKLGAIHQIDIAV